jgi:hypothetical protein
MCCENEKLSKIKNGKNILYMWFTTWRYEYSENISSVYHYSENTCMLIHTIVFYIEEGVVMYEIGTSCNIDAGVGCLHIIFA